MKRCPTCQRTFTDDHLTFCVDDGTPLSSENAPAAETSSDEVTRVSPSSRRDEDYSARKADSESTGSTPPYQPPGAYLPPGYTPAKRRAWPWVLGLIALVLVVIVGFGVAAAVFIPRALRASRSANANENANRNYGYPDTNRNSNSNSRESGNENGNDNDNDNHNSETNDATPAPTDQAAVLAELRDLEDEWTIANINADKKKLNRILADDYVGITDGRVQGKADYLKTVERDTSIQHWEFEDLKVTLNGDRASLTGILRLDVRDQKGQDQELTFRFTDKFVWRDGRWQATASEVDAVKPGTSV